MKTKRKNKPKQGLSDQQILEVVEMIQCIIIFGSAFLTILISTVIFLLISV